MAVICDFIEKGMLHQAHAGRLIEVKIDKENINLQPLSNLSSRVVAAGLREGYFIAIVLQILWDFDIYAVANRRWPLTR